MINEGVLIVFGKAPVAGNVKTRLIPDIGVDKATSLYKDLLNKTLNTAIKAGFSDIQLWLDGDQQHPFIKQLRHIYALEVYAQIGDDLGQRMYNTFDIVLKDYPYAVIIGSDCPVLTVSDLNLAATLLAGGKNIVIGPAEDGGYYLIGIRENCRQLFENMPWSEPSLFEETCSRIKQLDWQLGLLAERWDVDNSSTLMRLYP